MMDVSLVNDGPVTITIDSDGMEFKPMKEGKFTEEEHQ
jgi:hypothetical protein